MKLLRNQGDISFIIWVCCKSDFAETLNSNSHNLQNTKAFSVILEPKNIKFRVEYEYNFTKIFTNSEHNKR